LTSKNIPFFGVKTRLTIEEAKNGSGIRYSIIIPSMVEILEPEIKTRVKSYSDSIKSFLKRSDVYID
jgi:hypothetical protein